MPVANAHALARAIPHSRLCVLEDAGHLVFIEKAEEVNREVAPFLLGVEEEAHRARAARQSSAPRGRLEGLLRRLPGAAGRWARKLGDRLTR